MLQTKNDNKSPRSFLEEIKKVKLLTEDERRTTDNVRQQTKTNTIAIGHLDEPGDLIKPFINYNKIIHIFF